VSLDYKTIKTIILDLLREDKEFRYAVAGLIGLEEILKRLDRHEEELIKLREDIHKLYEKSLEHDKRFEELIKRLARIELEIGALNESFYCKALLDQLKEEFRERGEKIVNWRRDARLNDIDIDLLIETDRGIYVVETKIKPKHDDVGRLIAKKDVVAKYYRGKEVYAILSGAMIGAEVEEYAREKNIRVYQF